MQNKSATPEALDAAQRLLVTLDLPPISSFNENNSKRAMHIQRAAPDALDVIQNLLASLDLPHSDLAPSHLEHFFVCRDGDDLAGVIGLELYGEAALLRSLAVRPSHRSQGLGARLTERVERHARQNGARDIYLLTTTAADYFGRRGYEIVRREDLPPAIRETDEAAELCPSSAACMRKHVGVSKGETV